MNLRMCFLLFKLSHCKLSFCESNISITINLSFNMPKNSNFSYFEVSELNDRKDLPVETWKVRPCEWYKEEYKDCTSIRARFHQYFVHGMTVECNQWKQDYQNCMLFRKKNDLKALENVIESENKRNLERREAVEENDVWEYRNQPPVNWNSLMPAWMIEDKKNSLLIETQNLLNEGIAPSPIFTGISCTIL